MDAIVQTDSDAKRIIGGNRRGCVRGRPVPGDLFSNVFGSSRYGNFFEHFAIESTPDIQFVFVR